MAILTVIKDMLINTGLTIWQHTTEFLPTVIGALIILILGYVFARIVSGLAQKILTKLGVDKIQRNQGLGEVLTSLRITQPPSVLIKRILFWLMMLVVIMATAETLGLNQVTLAINSLFAYLPNVMAAIIVLLVGLACAQFCRNAIRSRGEHTGIDYSGALGNVVYGAISVLVITIVINQLEIEAQLLNYVILIALVAIGIAAALALGLGTRDIAANVVAGIYARDLYVVGSKLEVNGQWGELMEVSTVKAIVLTEEGKTLTLPNAYLISEQVNFQR